MSAHAQVRDRILALDPGMARSVTVAKSAVAMGATVGWEYLLARATGSPGSAVAMILGGFLAMISVFSVFDVAPARRIVSTLSLSAAMVAGLTLGCLAAPHQLLGSCLYVVVTVAAVWVRRFGPRLLGCGMTGWMGYLRAAMFSPVRPAGLGPLVVLLVTAAAVLAVLNVTVLRDRPRRRLARLARTFAARSRVTAASAAALLESRDGAVARRERRLERDLARLNEAALLIDGHLAVPDAATPPAARRIRGHLLDHELGVLSLVRATRSLGGLRATVPTAPGACRTAGELLEALAAGDTHRATALVERVLAERDRAGHADEELRQLAADACKLLTFEHGLDGLLPRRAVEPQTVESSMAAEPPFTSPVALFGGNFPGTGASVAAIPVERSGRVLRFLYGLRPTTRQAVQAGTAACLALVAGRVVDPHHYFWAAACCLVVFNGAATGPETVARSVHRTVGTALGLLPGIAIAGVFTPHATVAVLAILAVLSVGIALVPVSYGLAICCVTAAMGPLYGLLGTFSQQVMLVRLEETATGALISSIVVLVVLPTRNRPTARAARGALLGAPAELLDAVDTIGRRPHAVRTLHERARAVDGAMRQLRTVARPQNVPALLLGHTGAHQLTLYAGLAAHARALASRAERVEPGTDAARAVERTSALLRDITRAVAESPVHRRRPVEPKEAVTALLLADDAVAADLVR